MAMESMVTKSIQGHATSGEGAEGRRGGKGDKREQRNKEAITSNGTELRWRESLTQASNRESQPEIRSVGGGQGTKERHDGENNNVRVSMDGEKFRIIEHGSQKLLGFWGGNQARNEILTGRHTKRQGEGVNHRRDTRTRGSRVRGNVEDGNNIREERRGSRTERIQQLLRAEAGTKKEELQLGVFKLSETCKKAHSFVDTVTEEALTKGPRADQNVQDPAKKLQLGLVEVETQGRAKTTEKLQDMHQYRSGSNNSPIIEKPPGEQQRGRRGVQRQDQSQVVRKTQKKDMKNKSKHQRPQGVTLMHPRRRQKDRGPHV
ncbi:hypothetical protein BC829DRAFT_422346 [Chytridium lagenaria]|nr:hypothetical protein BC829DRAFT_422346 [Chytridium lagenaria]